MNKATLVEVIAQKTGLKKKEAEAALIAAFEAIEDDLATGGKIQISGFGSFKVREKAARKGRNPKTNEQIEIPASKSVVFTAGKALKDSINK